MSQANTSGSGLTKQLRGDGINISEVVIVSFQGVRTEFDISQIGKWSITTLDIKDERLSVQNFQ